MSKVNAVIERLGPAEVFDAIGRVARPMAATVQAFDSVTEARQVHGDVMYLAARGIEDIEQIYSRWRSWKGYFDKLQLESHVIEARCALATAHALAFLLKHYEEIVELIPGAALSFDEYDNAFYSAAGALGYKYKPELREEWIRKHEPDG